MSIVHAELPYASTEEIIQDMQDEALRLVQRAGDFGATGLQAFFAGDNPTVSIEQRPEGTMVRIDSVPRALGSAKSAVSVIVSLAKTAEGLQALPADDDRAVRAIVNGGVQHTPKRWPDGGCSFEPEIEGDSLPHDRVVHLSELVSQVSVARLIPIGNTYS